MQHSGLRFCAAGLCTALALVPGAGVAGAQDDSCVAVLAGFQVKTEENYAGFRIEVTGERRREYDAMVAHAFADARAADGDACFFALDRYVSWFGDPNLFVFQSTALDSAETMRRAAAVRMLPLTDEDIRAELTARVLDRDPIEGIWYDGAGLRVGIIRDPGAPQQFAAVVLSSDTAVWPVGSVRATIEPRSDGRYFVHLASRNHSLRHLEATIHKQTILRMSPVLWGREFPAPTYPGLVDSIDPRAPTLVWRGQTAIFSLPSHNPRYKSRLDSLAGANEFRLRTAHLVLIDLRGDEGGAAFMSDTLLPYVRSREVRANPYRSDSAFMLSSPDQIAYAKRAFGPDTSMFVRTLLDRLARSPGELVHMPPFTTDADTLILGPENVAIIADRGTSGAAEMLVLEALSSTRARVYGHPTAGTLDYPAVNVVVAHPGERRWYLAYPAISRYGSKPEHPMRGAGIAPDASIATESLLGTILEVEEREEARSPQHFSSAAVPAISIEHDAQTDVVPRDSVHPRGRNTGRGGRRE